AAMLLGILNRDRSQHQSIYPAIELLDDFCADRAEPGHGDLQPRSFQTAHFILPHEFGATIIIYSRMRLDPARDCFAPGGRANARKQDREKWEPFVKKDHAKTKNKSEQREDAHAG